MWGNDPETVAETIRVGINGTSPETRYAQMLAFGRDQMLERADIDAVVSYVKTLSPPELAATLAAGMLAAGARFFAGNAASCHGEGARARTYTEATNRPDQ